MMMAIETFKILPLDNKNQILVENEVQGDNVKPKFCHVVFVRACNPHFLRENISSLFSEEFVMASFEIVKRQVTIDSP